MVIFSINLKSKMMNSIKKMYGLVFISALTAISCSKALEENKPLTDDPTVPAVISNIKVVNGNGNATLTYVLPSDPHLLYVKAVYTISTGQQYQAKASSYNNTIVVEGFADTLEHEVKLYSVSRSDVVSEPVIVKIKPLLSPIWQVYKSIKIQNAFGGYNLTAVNASKSNVAVIVTKKNVFNEYEADNNKSVYTNTDSIISKVRGLDTATYRFGFFIKDRWGNKTDTIYNNVKPLFEAELPKSQFSAFALPGDASQVTNGAGLNYMWDNRLGWPYTSFTNPASVSGPHMVTFNLGVLAKISSIWIRPFPEGSLYYYLSTMKRFEIYGASSPSLSGALDASWTLLGSYTVKKPSGLPYGTDNTADQTTAAAGFSWEVNLSAPKVRYIRIRCLENFAGGTNQSINEIRVLGDTR
jgi:hypothetical protein